MGNDIGAVELVDRLFVSGDRLGWEYVPPAPLVPSPEADQQPVWVEPVEPELDGKKQPSAVGEALAPAAQAAKSLVGCWLVLVFFGVSAFAGMFGFAQGGLGGGVGGILLVFFGLLVVGGVVPTARKAMARARFRQERDAAYAAYEQELASWQKRVARHDKAEQKRYAAALRWYPLTPWSRPERVDVFGGTADGWASLLATFGSSMLCGGANILLLDFTEQHVGAGLAEFAAGRGLPVTQLELPAEWSRWHPFAGLEADEVAELLADSVHTLRESTSTAATVDGRALDAELFAAVVHRLGRPWTVARMAAAVRVLRRMHDADDRLSAAEVDRLSAAIDTVGHTERVQSALQFLGGLLDLLAHDEPDTVEDAAELWSAGLTVVCTSGSHRRRKDLLDRLVFHRIARTVRDQRSSGRDVVVVAGADHLGREGLAELARAAERGGVRLVLMLERLRDDLHVLLGGRHSATLLMRLGNAREATTAAEFVGRGHRFVLSQLTEQVGATFTEGVSAGYSLSAGTSESSSRGLSSASTNVGPVAVPTLTGNRSSSVTQTRTETWQDTVNQSLAESVTAGRTVSRVYEFTVEPTTVQALPATAFVLVETGPTGRRVVLGDCNPGITLLDKVATEPRRP